MPTEANVYWWPLLWVSGGIVGVGAVWFTRWVISRLEKDRTKLHQHGTALTVHEFKITELREDVDDLKEGK